MPHPDLELLGPLLPEHPPDPHSRNDQVQPPERLAIQRAYLLTPNASITQLAEAFTRDRETIRRCLRGSDFDALVQEVHDHIKADVTSILRHEAVAAARAWAEKAIPIAADKGDHKPAKDLLTAGKFIDVEGQDTKIVVQVGVNLAEGHVVDDDSR